MGATKEIEPKHVGRLVTRYPYGSCGDAVYIAYDVDRILDNDHDLIMEQRDEISKLKIKVNKLQQKIGE